MVLKVVYLTDEKVPYERAEEYFAEAAAWAKLRCSSFVDYHVQDVSDVSYIYDHVGQYGFADPKDALLFELKWKSN
jgi:hypothetical protein